jgi:hypothetical protein
MSKRFLLFAAAFCVLALFACAPAGSPENAASPEPSPVEAVQEPPTVLEQIGAASTPGELCALIETYQADGDFESMYLAAKKLIELDPSDPQAYENAITALLGGISDDYTEIERLIRLCIENAPDSASDFTHWANAQNQTFAYEVPFAADYRSADEINTLGISPGNLSNQDPLPDFWRNGLLTTQGDWIYLMLPTEDYYVYKMRLDGTGLTPVGDARGDNLNVIGDWLYYKNLNDADMPYRIRTDGTQKEGPLFNRSEQLAVTRDDYYFKDGPLFRSKLDLSRTDQLVNDNCRLMSYYDGWIYYCTEGAQGAFWRVSSEGGQPQKLLDDWMWHYDMYDGWIYYLRKADQFAVQRMRLDGSEQSIVYQSDVLMNSFGLADGKLVISICRIHDDHGKPYPTDLVVVDIATGEETQTIKAFSASIYTAKDYAYYYDENFVWSALNLTTGETGIISPAPVQTDVAANAPEEQQPSVVGNTSANLFMQMGEQAAGTLAGQDEQIYYGNPRDGIRLYTATRQGGETQRQMLEDSISCINLVGSTLYYCNNNKDFAI